MDALWSLWKGDEFLVLISSDRDKLMNEQMELFIPYTVLDSSQGLMAAEANTEVQPGALIESMFRETELQLGFKECVVEIM